MKPTLVMETMWWLILTTKQGREEVMRRHIHHTDIPMGVVHYLGRIFTYSRMQPDVREIYFDEASITELVP